MRDERNNVSLEAMEDGGSLEQRPNTRVATEAGCEAPRDLIRSRLCAAETQSGVAPEVSVFIIALSP